MTVLALSVAAVALYLWAVGSYDRRFPQHRYSFLRIGAFISGIAVLTVALLPFADAMADRSFTAHMVQHLAIMLVAVPLVLLGAPLLLIVAVPPARTARRFTAFAHGAWGKALFAPLTGWIALVAVLWAAHFSPLYEAALQHPAVHVFEHVLFIGTAFLFWGAIVQVGYAPRPVPFAARMLYLFLAIPQGAFLGLAIYSSRSVLYAHYLLASNATTALTDQQTGGAVMWMAGGFIMFAAFMLTAAAWAMSERAASTAAEPRVAMRY
jgi:cytochrome c oxidase assembly factor CtaG